MAIVSVVKYDGNPDVFAWKYPDSELGTWTQLIVNESQQAILFKGGQALDVFEAGRHTLSTNNIPFLETIINLPFGGQSPFSAEVWFVSKQFNLDVKWGTPCAAGNQDALGGFSRDEKSRTFSSNSRRSHILRTSSRSIRLILSSIVSLAVWLKCTRTI